MHKIEICSIYLVSVICLNPQLLDYNYQMKVFSSKPFSMFEGTITNKFLINCLPSKISRTIFTKFESGACSVQWRGWSKPRRVQSCENNPTWRIQWKVNISKKFFQIFNVSQSINISYRSKMFQKYFKVLIIYIFQNFCQRHCCCRVWEKCCVQKGNPTRY